MSSLRDCHKHRRLPFPQHEKQLKTPFGVKVLLSYGFVKQIEFHRKTDNGRFHGKQTEEAFSEMEVHKLSKLFYISFRPLHHPREEEKRD
jgi:hypothetical protein